MRLFIIIILVFVVVLVYGCLTVSARESRREEHRRTANPTPPKTPVEPCEKCLRWPECNGVDQDCPLLSAEAKTPRED